MAHYTCTEAGDGLWVIQEETVRCFLLVGEKRALLIDTGCEIDDLKSVVEKITFLPITTVITHADGDHTGCISQFEPVYMSPSEYAYYHEMTGKNTKLYPIWDGDIFDLGNRKVLAVMNPGHTSGCCTFLDIQGRRLIGGDSIQRNGDLYMYGPTRDLLAAVHSLERMVRTFGDRIDRIYPAHAECPIPAKVMTDLLESYRKMLRGEIGGTEAESFGTPIRVFDLETNRVLYEKRKMFFE